MRKACTFLCGVLAAALISGCGATMPDLTQEETDIISEYAIGILLKYDKRHKSRLVDTTVYDETAIEEIPEEPEEDIPEGKPDDQVSGTEVVDVSQDVEPSAPPATIEEYYGIEGITFQYLGYELTQSYPSASNDEVLFFAMDAAPGAQLLVLRFAATNVSSADQTLNMLGSGARFRVSVNGEANQSVLTTMLLDDMQTYNDVLPAGYSVELVSIIEVPQGTSVETIDFIMRGKDENVTMRLQ